MSRQSRNAGGAAVASSATRMNEYFVPRDGIDREVISADICRYLGNDALVRPGHYDNPQTGQTVQGYYITAYRNLTTAMIEDLKADSARWDSERRALANRPMNASGGQYRNSETHQSRQNQGPTEPPYHQQDNYRDGSFDQPRQPGSSSGYNNSPNYQPQQQANYAPPAGNSGYAYAQGSQHMQDPRYGQPSGQQSTMMGQGYQSQETYIGAASHLQQQQRYPNDGYNGQRPGPSGNAPPQPVYATNPPPQQQYSTSGSGYQYQGHPPSNTPQYSSMQPQDPFYGRASPAGPPQSSSGYHPQGQQLQQQYDETPPARSTASPANTAAQTSPGQPSRPNDRETNRQSSERLQRPPPRR